MIPRVLSQTRRQKADLILVVPLWRAQAWFPVLMGMILAPPILLPSFWNLLLDPAGLPHPLIVQEQLRLVAWRVSGKDGVAQAFSRMLPPSSTPGHLTPIGDMLPLGDDGFIGAMNGVPIPFQRMSAQW